jgi:ATP-dependent Clp protease ATP-binding subunit ClpA
MLDRLTLDAVSLIERATDVARQFGHSYIGPEHLLLAFAAWEGSPESQALKFQGLVESVLTKQIEAMFGRKPPHNLILRFNTEAKDLLQTSWPGVQWSQTEQISAQDIFQVLMSPRSVTVYNILRSLSVSTDKLADVASVLSIQAEKASMDAVALVNPAPAQSVHEAAATGSLGGSAREKTVYLTANSEIPMAEGDFTEAANFALLFARVEAATFNFASRQIDSSCLLVGLALEQSGTAGKYLRSRGATMRSIRGAAGDSISQKLMPRDLECLVFDAQTRRILRSARAESRKQNHKFVTSLHLLLAILSSGHSRANDILSTLVDDLAALKTDLSARYPSSYEGSLGELELNDRLFSVLQAGEPPPHFLYGDKGDATVEAPVAGFDLSHLTPGGLAVMESALREYSTLKSASFEQKHLFLGILADGKSRAASYLAAWGVTLKLARRKVFELEERAFAGDPKEELDDSVAIVLAEALAMAKKTDASKAGPEHLLWALMISGEPQVKLLFERLGLDTAQFFQQAADLYPFEIPAPATFFPRFATMTPAGLHIYGMICEPSVALAMQIALNEAESSGADGVAGDFLVLGLLSAPGEAGEVLRSLGLQPDKVRGLQRQFYAPQQSVEKDKKAKKSQAKIKPKTRELDFDPQLEQAFFQALANSLQTRQAAVKTENLLFGLIESDNLDFIRVLELCGTSPLAVLEKLSAEKSTNQSDNPAVSLVERIIGGIDIPIAPSLRIAIELAAEVACSIGANVLDILVLVYGLSHAQTGPIADKLFSCGLDRSKLKELIETRALHSKGPVANQPHVIDMNILAVMAGAFRFAGLLGQTEIECEHLMLAILEVCQSEPHKQILPTIGLIEESLATQLLIPGTVPCRAQNMQLGAQLIERLYKMDISAKAVVVNAAALAAAAGRSFIDTEQLLLAIVKCSTTRLENLLRASGLIGASLEARILRYTSPVMEFSLEPVTFSCRVDAIFKEADAAAAKSNKLVSVEELLLALLKEKGGIASYALNDLGVSRQGLVAKLQLAFFVNTERSPQGQTTNISHPASAAAAISNPSSMPKSWPLSKPLPLTEPSQAGSPASYTEIPDDAKAAKLQHQMATWFNRAALAYKQKNIELCKQALLRGWHHLKEIGKLQGFAPTDNPQEPEYYFGKNGRGMPTLAEVSVSDWFAAPKESDVLERIEAKTAASATESKPGIDLSVFDPETAAIFSAAQSIAEQHPTPTDGPIPFIEPCHFLVALLQIPELARLVCLDAADEKLLGPGGALAIWCDAKTSDPVTDDTKAQDPETSVKAKAKGKTARGQPAKKVKKGQETQKTPGSEKTSAPETPESTEAMRSIPLDFSPATKKLLTASFEQSRLFPAKNAHIWPEHLLLAILAEPDALCSDVLDRLQVETAAARLRIFGYITDRARER